MGDTLPVGCACDESIVHHKYFLENPDYKNHAYNTKYGIYSEALHRADAYKHLMNEEDIENLKWLKIFNKYDLYSKSKVRIDVEKVKPYYLSLIKRSKIPIQKLFKQD
ncbi:hypothetical protein REPUB_Repub04eG0226300 [Reevesia pubescens]